MRTYTALIFDLFDTLIDFQRDRMPLIQVNGAEVRSTSRHVYDQFTSVCPGVPFEAFYAAFMERFRIVLSKLRVPFAEVPSDFPEWLAEVHMAKLSEAMVFPPEHRPLLEWARARYRLAVISNFDHARTARRVLERTGTVGWFEQVVVSAEEGVRKPHREIFVRTLARMGLAPQEALFIGDSLDIDIAGAKGVGMDVAWVNRGGQAVGGGVPAPDYTLSRLTELRQKLDR